VRKENCGGATHFVSRSRNAESQKKEKNNRKGVREEREDDGGPQNAREIGVTATVVRCNKKKKVADATEGGRDRGVRAGQTCKLRGRDWVEASVAKSIITVV